MIDLDVGENLFRRPRPPFHDSLFTVTNSDKKTGWARSNYSSVGVS